MGMLIYGRDLMCLTHFKVEHKFQFTAPYSDGEIAADLYTS